MTEDAAFFDRALRRVDRIAVALAAAAVIAFLVREGWKGALGCGFTSAASVYNLRRLKAVAAGVGGDDGGGAPSRTGSAVALGMRYLILGAICFVIIKFLGVSLAAIFAGLLVSVAAVLAEIIYELLFIR